MIEAHHTSPLLDRQQEERRNRTQPEDQIQKERQPTQAQAMPDGPHQVVHHPQNGAQQKGLPHDRRLSQHIHRHGQRSSRAKKPPVPAERSSS